MRHLTLAIGLLSILVIGASSSAYACPATYAAYTCDGGTGLDICELSAGTVWECNLAKNGTTTGGSITAVYGISATNDYSAWGTDAAGNNFCCELTSSTLDRVSLTGSPNDDTLAFTYLTYNLDNHGGVSKITAWAGGRGGNDTIYGSYSASGQFDSLHGDEGNDTIYGYDGADEVTGDSDNDVLFGGNGADIIHGNDGNDTIYGGDGGDSITGDGGVDQIDAGDGTDFVTGGSDGDTITGGNGQDCLMGNEGNDALCGDGGNDSLCGGADDDQIFGGGGTDDADGGQGTDACSGETSIECESTLTKKPATCP